MSKASSEIRKHLFTLPNLPERNNRQTNRVTPLVILVSRN